jgi:ATP-dependent RNA helicase DDX41
MGKRPADDEEPLLDPDEDDTYEEYVPLSKRKKAKTVALLKKHNKIADEKAEEEEEDGASKPIISLAKNTEEIKAQIKDKLDPKIAKSLLVESAVMRKEMELNADSYEQEKLRQIAEEEQRILKQVENQFATPLQGVRERAKGVSYTERLPPIAGWRPPRKYREMPKEDLDALREKYYIDVSGADVPPLIKTFQDMRLPRGMIEGLKAKGIQRPTQIQMQGIPCGLMGRDVIGIAFTGSGKTMVFVVPMLIRCLEYELRTPLARGEGPFGLIMAPSRELANQNHEVANYFCRYLVDNGMPMLRSALCMGGISTAQQGQSMNAGIHFMTATPGRINDLLTKRRLSLAQCKILTLDEADRMVDLGFEDELRNVLDSFQGQRQTLLFSATMPKKIQDFASSALVDACVVNVGRAGAANLDVVQEVEYVKQEAKLLYLLHCLQKSPPPVLIFCENKADVDDVHEYLLLKGVDACAIHGGLAQEERHDSIRSFKEGTKDVLIGTDVASKGLDFPAIQHVINFDMPKEVENYIHRIGRTGRCGRTGIATTFVNKNDDETILMDLKAILLEANQRIPPFLKDLEPPGGFREVGGIKGCAYCGGLGHRVTSCPKLEETRRKTSQGINDSLVGSGSRYTDTKGYGGEW